MPQLEERRISAFQLVDYVLYASAIFLVWYDLYTQTVKYVDSPLSLSLNTQYMLSSKGDVYADITLNFILGVFIFFVYCRNYVVMTSIDMRPSDRHVKYRFLNENYDFYDLGERILRILIVFLVLVSARGAFQPFTDAVVSINNYLFTAYGEHPDYAGQAQDLAYYSVVLFILFLLFMLYDFLLVCSFRSRTELERSDLAKKIDENYSVSTVISTSPDLESILSYLNLVSKLDGNRLHLEKSARKNFRKWISKWNPFLFIVAVKSFLKGYLVCSYAFVR